MNWEVRVTGPARKSLKRIPCGYYMLIARALEELEEFPFRGDIQKLGLITWQKRVASYRIFFDVYYKDYIVVVTAITRRQSKTYRR